MSYVQLSEGGFQVDCMYVCMYDCGPSSPELSKSYMDMASKLCTFTLTFTCGRGRGGYSSTDPSADPGARGPRAGAETSGKAIGWNMPPREERQRVTESLAYAPIA